MMQQFASFKPGSAASALPLEISINNRVSARDTSRDANNDADRSRQQFDEVFQQQSNRPSAFAQARENAERAAAKQVEASSNSNVNSRANKNPQDDNIRNDQVIRKTESVSRNDARESAVNRSSEQNTSANQKEQNTSQSSAKEEQANSASEVSGSKAKQDLAKEASALTNAESKQASQTAIGTENGPVEINTNKLDDFDYINYVSQLAEFTNADGTVRDKQMPELDPHGGATLDGEIDIAEILLGNSDDVVSESDAKLTQAALSEEEQANRLQAIGITKDDLQLILDAQNAQLDLNSDLSEAQLAKLQNIIADMLNKLSDKGNGDEGNTDVVLDHEDLAQVELADQALVASLIINAKQNTQSDEASKQDALSKLAAMMQPQLGSDKAQTIANPISEPASGIDTEDSTLGANLPDLNRKIDDKNIWRETPDLSQIQILPEHKIKGPNVGPDVIKGEALLNNIIALSDEQTELAANSLKERLQASIPELKTEAKGSEFVAALQSGLKEFKQQLAQGREPGMDFKDLVAQALASANIDADKSVLPKIDAAANQFNAVLNLANSVNHSANLQQAQVLGITDNHLAKEINSQTIEGTKLANTTANNALNAANADKAVNIFKPEGQAQLAEKVRWMVNSRNPSAEIRLDPPDLGAINIKVHISGDTAQVNFTVQSMGAKEALDQAAPRLRDMLQQQGIELGQSSVQQESSGQQNQGGDFAGSGEGGNGAVGGILADGVDESLENAQGLADGVIEQRISNGSVGGIDYYA